MARVTVGVPVYNAEPFLEECLDNLLGQTFRDIRIVVSDNGSTDRTWEIAQSVAARDSRVEIIRQAENLGPLANFEAVCAAADTPYFLWRAHDDLSDANYIAELVTLLDGAPRAQLAVGRIASRGMDCTLREEVDFIQRRPWDSDLIYAIRLLFGAHPSFIYGLFRREAAGESLRRVIRTFGHVRAWDIVAVFPFLVSRRIVGTDRTTFVQRLPVRQQGPRGRTFRDPDTMAKLRRDWVAYCVAYLPELEPNPVARFVLRLAVDLRVGYRRKILSARYRVWRGEKPVAGNYELMQPGP